jgi:hypothetical protein
MRRVRALVTPFLLTLGLATAAFAGVAAAGELSKKEYKAGVNDICAAFAEERDAAFGEAFEGLDETEEPSPEQLAAALDTVIPIFREALGGIEELDGPNSLEKKVNKVVDQYRDILEAIEADLDVVTGEDAEDPFAAADKQARKLGIGDCAQGEGEHKE